MMVFLFVLAIFAVCSLTVSALFVIVVSIEEVPWSRRGLAIGALLLVGAAGLITVTATVTDDRRRENVEHKAQACLDKGGTPLTIGRDRDDVACVYGSGGEQ